jgi:hypothetical protein
MKLLKLNDFLDIFKSNDVTFAQFLKKAVVVGRNKETKLKDYIIIKNIDISDIKMLFDFILNKNVYLTRVYNRTLKPLFNVPPFIKEEPMKNKLINNIYNTNYKNIIRNMFYLETLRDTSPGHNITLSFLDVLHGLFVTYRLDTKLLAPAYLKFVRDGGNLSTILSSYFFRASILNPYVVFSINKNILKGKRIFCPVLSWCSPVIGFLEDSNVNEYVATDIIPSVCNKASQIIKEFYPKTKHEIFCSQSELLLENKYFLDKYNKHFDTIFFCPPYFDLEIYPGKKQSTYLYKTEDEWLIGYWKNTMNLCFDVLENKGKLCYIIGSNDELVKKMVKITVSVGFKRHSNQLLLNNIVTTKEQNNEIIFVFTK